MAGNKSTVFIKGTILLSLSVIITKILGVAFKVPLSYVLGDEGMGYFNTAYAIYGFFYILCTAGVPKSIMLILSGRDITDITECDKRFILKCGLGLFIKIGLIVSLLNITCAPALARIVGNSKATLSIVAVAPSIFFVSASGVLRGYLNSDERLGEIAASQVIEGGVKLGLGLAFSFIGARLFLSVSAISALAIMGITAGSIINFIYLFKKGYYSKPKDNNKQTSAVSKKLIRRQILKNALPIALSSSLLNLSSTLDLTIIMKRLVEAGMSESEANSAYGNYTTLAVPMFMLVISVLSPLATSYMPRLSGVSIEEDKREFTHRLNRLLWITLIISVPAMLAFYFYSFDLLDILFSLQSSAIGAQMLVCLSLGLCALTALTVTNTALESQGRITAAVVSLLVGALVKLVVSYILTGCASVGILGAPLGTVASYVVSLTVSVVALDIMGVKVRVTVKLALLLLVGIVCFYPPYKIIYSTGALSSSFASLIVALGVSCVAYVAVLLPCCVLVTGFDMFKMHKK